MNYGLIGAAYAALHATHGIADYWFQTDWQAQNKSKRWDALLRHVATYSASFIPVGIWLVQAQQIPTWKAWALPFVIGIPHAWMDRRRFLMWFLTRTKGWTMEQVPTLSPAAVAVRTHVTIHMDQKFHYLCLFGTALWLAS